MSYTTLEFEPGGIGRNIESHQKISPRFIKIVEGFKAAYIIINSLRVAFPQLDAVKEFKEHVDNFTPERS